MSAEELQQEAPQVPNTDTELPDANAIAAPAAGRKRPRLDLTAMAGGGERKRGKSMFGVLVNTLNKAKAEDKERNASEAAKRRQLIDHRLQTKLKKDADSVRQAEQAKKDRVTANRREEGIQLTDSIYKLRRTRLPQLSNFLITSDVIPPLDAVDTEEFSLQSFLPPRSHPPPLYYLPAILTPAQEKFLLKRKAQVKEATEKEWEDFREERAKTLDEIMDMRRSVAAAEETTVAEKQTNGGDAQDADVAANGDGAKAKVEEMEEMEVDDGAKDRTSAKKDETPGGNEGEDVEY